MTGGAEESLPLDQCNTGKNKKVLMRSSALHVSNLESYIGCKVLQNGALNPFEALSANPSAQKTVKAEVNLLGSLSVDHPKSHYLPGKLQQYNEIVAPPQLFGISHSLIEFSDMAGAFDKPDSGKKAEMIPF